MNSEAAVCLRSCGVNRSSFAAFTASTNSRRRQFVGRMTAPWRLVKRSAAGSSQPVVVSMCSRSLRSARSAIGLGLFELEHAGYVGQSFVDSDRAAFPVDVVQAQREQLADAEPAVRGDVDR